MGKDRVPVAYPKKPIFDLTIKLRLRAYVLRELIRLACSRDKHIETGESVWIRF